MPKIKYKILLVSLLILASCTFRVPKDPYALVRILPSDPENLNPITYTTSYAASVMDNIYEPLFTLNPETLLPKPILATHWEISDDKLHYTFHLRRNVKWSDGKPMTADDVIYSFQKIKDPKIDAAPLRNYFKDLQSVEKLAN